MDSFFPLMEKAEDKLADLEEQMTVKPTVALREKVRQIRRDLQRLGRQLRLLRDALGGLTKRDHEVIKSETRPFLADCYDHVLFLVEDAARHREATQDLLELYASLLSQRNNEATQTLTIIATVFIPLSFLAGLYGMNFDPDISPWNMPELKTRCGYPAVLFSMVVIAAALTRYFYRKGWFGSE